MRNQQPARHAGRDVAVQAQRATVELTREFQRELDTFSPNLTQALPKHISLDRFKRVLITACAMNPDLLHADRRTLYLAAVKCASDGLLPDGRQAALVVYNTEVKMRDPATGLDTKFRIDAVQFMPMLAGIRERMRNTGEVLSADAQVVHKHDIFAYDLGDDAYIKHTPAPLDQDRGEIIGAYAIIRLKSGEVIRDVMRLKDIEERRQHSRAPNSLMWTKFFAEGARKTVLRRAAKAAPQTSEMERLFERDDEDPLPAGELTALPAHEPLPLREIEDDAEPEPVYALIDLDGEVFEYHTAATAAKALQRLYEAADERGQQFVTGVTETNRELLEQLRQEGHSITLPPAASEAHTGEGKAAAGRVAGDDEEATSAPADAEPYPLGEERSDTKAIRVPMKGDRPDYRTWALGLMLPRLRKMRNTADLATLLGDNEETLGIARKRLGAADLRELDQAIEAQWAEIAKREKEPVDSG